MAFAKKEEAIVVAFAKKEEAIVKNLYGDVYSEHNARHKLPGKTTKPSLSSVNRHSPDHQDVSRSDTTVASGPTLLGRVHEHSGAKRPKSETVQRWQSFGWVKADAKMEQ